MAKKYHSSNILRNTTRSKFSHLPIKVGLERQTREEGVLPVGPSVRSRGGLRVDHEQSLQRVELSLLFQALPLLLLKLLLLPRVGGWGTTTGR